jgi:hypothetical protein
LHNVIDGAKVLMQFANSEIGGTMREKVKKPGEYVGRGQTSVPFSCSLTPRVDALLRKHAGRRIGAFISELVYRYDERLRVEEELAKVAGRS